MNDMTGAVTVASVWPTGDWPQIYPTQNWPSITYGYVQTLNPTECAGDIHVFPCPHCNLCKCGGAVKAKK